LTDQDRPIEEVTELKETLIKITSAQIWQRLQNAGEVMTEVPFGIFEDQTYLTGTIDLIFREDREWVLIDYKTDAIRDDDHLRQLKEYYWPQVEVYKNSWERITGEPVKEIGLFFTNRLTYESL